MSQPRMRKMGPVAEGPRGRSSVVKASGDSSIPNPNRHQPARSRSKNKIPKNIRYDLDNALVGLCDVWFEDIKPHLIRNNIKVHIHGDSSIPASGDHKRAPAGAPGCSHLDPGAASDHHRHQCVNFAGCSATPPTASRAPCRRPPAPVCPTSPLQLLLQSLNVQQKCKNANGRARSQRAYDVQPQPFQRPALDCQVHTAPTMLHRSPTRILRSKTPPSFLRRHRACQTENSFPIWCKKEMVDKSTQTVFKLRLVNRKSYAQEVRSRTRMGSPTFDRCPGKTTLFPFRMKSQSVSPQPISKSLIDEVVNSNSKLVKVLFQSPRSAIFNSSESQLEIPKAKRKQKAGMKIPPWR